MKSCPATPLTLTIIPPKYSAGFSKKKHPKKVSTPFQSKQLPVVLLLHCCSVLHRKLRRRRPGFWICDCLMLGKSKQSRCKATKITFNKSKFSFYLSYLPDLKRQSFHPKAADKTVCGKLPSYPFPSNIDRARPRRPRRLLCATSRRP